MIFPSYGKCFRAEDYSLASDAVIVVSVFEEEVISQGFGLVQGSARVLAARLAVSVRVRAVTSR